MMLIFEILVLLLKILYYFFFQNNSTELEGLFACPDYDDVRFGIDYSKEKETLMFSFRIPNFTELFAIAGEYFLNKHYPCNYLKNN